MKYFVTNSDKCVLAMKDGKHAIGSLSKSYAKKFAYEEGLKFISNELNNDTRWSLQKLYTGNVKNNKKYIITTASNFAGNGGTITNIFASAKPFKSAADAESYIMNNRNINKSFGKPVIIDEDFNIIEQSKKKTFTDEQLAFLGLKKSTPRVVIQKHDRIKIYEKSNGVCAICGFPITYEESTVDHIYPLSRGGSNTIDNLRMTCKKCNNMKGDLTDKEMYDSIKDIVVKSALEEDDNELSNMLIRIHVRKMINKYARK